ncbi:MAG: hypothetical protein ACRDOB_16175 [Streptosporangiaceae bacterium]
MRDVARDPAALELLRVQRGRLADRMRPPWWYLTGIAILWALAFACPFTSRFLPQGVRIWPILVAATAVAGLLQWGLARATGIAVTTGSLRYPSGRPAQIAMIVVAAAALVTETFLIRRGLIVAAIVVAALAVVAELALSPALLRGIRQDLRAGGGAA